MLNPGILLDILDPRGRCNRKGLLIAALILMAAQLAAGVWLWQSGHGLDHPIVVAIKIAFLYAAFSAAAQRMHDTGRSAWRMLWVALAILVWSVILGTGLIVSLPPDRLQPGTIGFAMMLTGLSLPMLAALTWLHVAPGEPRANRFGPMPQGTGFARHKGLDPPSRAAVAGTPA